MRDELQSGDHDDETGSDDLGDGIDEEADGPHEDETSDEPTPEELGLSPSPTSATVNASTEGADAKEDPGIDASTSKKMNPKLRIILSDSKLLEALSKHVVFEYRVLDDIAEEVVQRTYLRASKARTWPTNPKYVLAWMKRISANAWKDYCRENARAKRVIPSADLDPSDDRPTLDVERKAKRGAEQVAAESEHAPADVEMLKDYAAGKTHAEIAEERGIPEATVRQRTHRVSKRIREFMTAASLALAILLFMLKPEPPDLVRAGRPWPSPEDPLQPLPPHRTAEEERGTALKLCQTKRYEACLATLNMARRMDPDGEKDPAVVAARREAEQAVLGRKP